MNIIEPGHVYDVDWLDVAPGRQDVLYTTASLDDPVLHGNRLIFVNREKGHEHAGTISQEVLRVLIDRTQHCDRCLRWAGNDQIVYHLRMALVLHEARALERKTEKGIIHPERYMTGDDGHFVLTRE